MRKFKNIQWIILYVFILTTSIVYSFQSGVEKTEIQEVEKVTLTFRHFWTKEHDRPMLQIFQDVVDEFQRTHPNVKVNFEGLDQTEHREQKLKSEMVTGTPPDMFVLFGGAELEPYVRSNRLLDVSHFIQDNQLNFHDLSLWTFEDKVYGLPFEGFAQPLFYSKKILNELDLQPPTTLDELSNVINVLLEFDYIPFALGNEDLWPATVYAHYLMDRFGGPEMIENIASGHGSFVNAGYKQAFDQLQEWAATNVFNYNPSNVSTETAINLFNEGKTVMYLNGNWDITLFRSIDGSDDFKNNIGVIPFPSLLPDQDRSIAGGYSIGFGLSSNLTAAQEEAAFQLLKAIYTEEVQLRIVYEGQRLPSMVIPFDVSRTGPIFAQVIKLFEQSNSSFIAYDNVLSPEVRKAFWSITDTLIKGEISSEEALLQLEEASQAYFKLING